MPRSTPVTDWARRIAAAVVDELAARADAERAMPMRRYMRDQFDFFGVPAPEQRAAVRAALAAAGAPSSDAEVAGALERLWRVPQREARYAGCDLAARWSARRAGPDLVPALAAAITTDPWWDTCDTLARRSVGSIVRRHPDLRPTMDEWLAGDELWLVRSAILHMGGWRDAIDREWVFAAALARADHPDFFVRKAIGWILRDLAWVDPGAVAGFLAGPGRVLSPLSKREAAKHLGKLLP